MQSKKLLLAFLLCLIYSDKIFATELNLSDFETHLSTANQLENIPEGSPEGVLLESLNEIAETVRSEDLTITEVDAALTLLNSTDLIEEMLPRETNINFPQEFLTGADLSLSDMVNASYFLNSLNKKKLENMKNIEQLTTNSLGVFSNTQNVILDLSKSNVAEIINQLEQSPSIDLVQLSSSVSVLTDSNKLSEVTNDISNAAEQLNSSTQAINSTTQTLSFAAGSAMAAAAYSLDQAANAIANTISAGVVVDLDAASQGLGYNDFAAAVEAYNQQYGTNYSVDSAKEALGQ